MQNFGARHYDAKIGRWWGVDPLVKEYAFYSPHCFVANNCINAIDPDGQKIIFVNGYYNTGDGAMPKLVSEKVIGTTPLRPYWGEMFIWRAKKFFKDQNIDFVDGAGEWNSTGEDRFNAGYAYAKANFKTITAGMVKGETIKIVSHSMGGLILRE